MKDRILAFVRQNGPSLPVEVANKVGGNSFLAKAYLEELVEKGLLKRSSEKIGQSYIYYTAEQEPAVKEKVRGLGAKKTARTYAPKDIEVTPEIAKKREEFDSHLKKIEAEEANIKAKKAVINFRPKIEVIPRKPLIEAAKNVVKNIIDKPEKPKKDIDTFVSDAITFLANKNIEILQKEEKSKSADLVVNVPSAVGSVKFFVKVKSKKRISRSELVAIYAEALEQRMPSILLTNAELAETAKKYLKATGGFLRVKVF